MKIIGSSLKYTGAIVFTSGMILSTPLEANAKDLTTTTPPKTECVLPKKVELEQEDKKGKPYSLSNGKLLLKSSTPTRKIGYNFQRRIDFESEF